MILLLRRLILRPLWADRGRTITTLLSIALGVAVIFAMDLAGEAAAGSFKSSMETVSGQDDIEILAYFDPFRASRNSRYFRQCHSYRFNRNTKRACHCRGS